MIFARKVNTISEFHMIFARKMPEFYVIIARKIFFRKFGGRTCPLPPVSYAYAGLTDIMHKFFSQTTSKKSIFYIWRECVRCLIVISRALFSGLRSRWRMSNGNAGALRLLPTGRLVVRFTAVAAAGRRCFRRRPRQAGSRRRR